MNAQAVAKLISDWLADYLMSSPLSGFVVGVSGGVDSALVASLCARTKYPTYLLTLPIKQSDPEVDRGKQICDKLVSQYPNVKHLEINLDKLFATFTETLPAGNDNLLVLANTRARLRMTTLYAIAGNQQALVVGTGNKVEDFGIGFYTKHGDGAVDISPIADLTKTQVFQVAKYVEVPNSILSAAPTDGLWDDEREDEQQIGATYKEIEWAMEYHGDGSELNPEQLKILAIFKQFSNNNAHKFNPIPVCRIPDRLLEMDEN